jgi:hypothetical protein
MEDLKEALQADLDARHEAWLLAQYAQGAEG